MDEEISAYSRRIAAGIEVTPQTVAADLIKERGPQGETYLTADHTLARLRSAEYVKPRLAVSGLRSLWAGQGSRDTYALARDRVKKLDAAAAPAPDARRARAMEEIIAGFSASR
jgi:trimethylamine:corrinoid methyltransferase-like protein